MSRVIGWNLINDVRDSMIYPVRKHEWLDGFGYVLVSLKHGTVCNVKTDSNHRIINLNVSNSGILSTMINAFNEIDGIYDFYFDFGSSFERSEFLLRISLEDRSIFAVSSFDELEQYVLELISPVAYMLEYATFDSYYHGRMLNDVKSTMQMMRSVEELKKWLTNYEDI